MDKFGIGSGTPLEDGQPLLGLLLALPLSLLAWAVLGSVIRFIF